MIVQKEAIQITAVIDILENVLSNQTYEDFRVVDLSATEVREAIVTLLRIRITCQSD